ncbi:MAG: hypothetical protein GY804_09615 [Alphaproteobacteria bacterium]|nr:hypothetical protein [Alphaproteobacteria bacterium]
MDDEQKVKEAYKLLRGVRDDVYRLFSVGWGRLPSTITGAERSLTEQLLKNYGYDCVRDAFSESAAYGGSKLNLAYVRTVAKNKYEQRSAEKEIKEAKELKKEPVYDFSKDKKFQELLDGKQI